MSTYYLILSIVSNQFLVKSYASNHSLDKALYIDDYCHFFDSDFKVIDSLPGHRFCKIISKRPTKIVASSVDGHSLIIYDKSQNKLISKIKFDDEIIHHDLQISDDKTKIAFLTQATQKIGGKEYKFDVINVFDTSFKPIFKVKLKNEINTIRKMISVKDFVHKKTHGRDFYELFHPNSLHFIPKTNKLILNLARNSSIMIFNYEKKVNYTLHQLPDCSLTHSARFYRGSIYVLCNYRTISKSHAFLAIFNMQNNTFSYENQLSVQMKSSSTRGHISFKNDNLLITYKSGRIQLFNLKSKKLLLNKKLNFKAYGYPEKDLYQIYYLSDVDSAVM